MDPRVARPPAVALGLVGGQIVQDHVPLRVRLVEGDQVAHEVQKLPSPPAPVVPGAHLAGGLRSSASGGHLQRGKPRVVPLRWYSWEAPVRALPWGRRSQPWARYRA